MKIRTWKLLSLILWVFITESQTHRPSSRYSQGKDMVINRTVCAGLGGVALGVALGIGFGALIFDRPWKHGNVGGGIWFGKRRRKREVERKGQEEDDDRIPSEWRENLFKSKYDRDYQ